MSKIPTDAQWADLASKVKSKADSSTTYTKTEIDAALASKASTSSLATVATSGSYNDLSNKPTIPTVNNATLTITQNSASIGTFTANASSNVTIDIETPTTFTTNEWNALWA